MKGDIDAIRTLFGNCDYCLPAFADSDTIGSDGIVSEVTGLDGSGVFIGQAEEGRSGKWMYDNLSHSAMGTDPQGVYFRTSGGLDAPNSMHVDNHATTVASVMIGEEGVATGASLLSAAFGENGDDVDLALTLNRIATLGGGLVRAINLSTHRPLGFFESPNGSSHIASFIDWSARQHDVLYVVAWANDDMPQPRTPIDNFNGITVASSEKRMNENSWRSFSSSNNTDGLEFDDAMNIHLLAPGKDVLAKGFDDDWYINDGASYAAPHVTGATALLHQYSNQHFGTANSRRHEVMKAIMMNSADKISGVHGSNRTVCDNSTGPCVDWLQSEAYSNPTIPLDDRMGAGHLNVRRAVQQFMPGEHNPGMVPLIGWDYGPMPAFGSVEYVFDQPLGGGQYIAITLVWDRVVNSSGGNSYSSGDQFFSFAFPNLDLQLQTMDGTVIASSISTDTNFEHIFTDNIGAGQYKIVVSRICCDGQEFGNYALAWWYGDAASPVPGDYSGNGTVGPEDYAIWKAAYGSTVTPGTGADGNGDGIVDAADYTVWRNNLSAGSGGLAAVPEPATIYLFGIAILSVRMRTTQKASRMRWPKRLSHAWRN